MSRVLPIFFNIVYNDIPYDIFQPLERQPPSKYYNRVYLCTEKVTTKNTDNNFPIHGFVCKKFSDFEFADNYLHTIHNKDKIRSAMIPICKWSPAWLDKYILNFRLKKMFWLGKHSIYK